MSIEDNRIIVSVSLTVNGEKVSMWMSFRRDLWEMFSPDDKLQFIKRIKSKLLDRATAGLEPVVEILDDVPCGWAIGGPYFDKGLTTGDSVEIGATK